MDYNKIYESEQLDEALNKRVAAVILALGLTVAPMFAKSAKKNNIPPETILNKIEKQFDGQREKVISTDDYFKARKIYYDSIGSQPDFLNDEFKETLLKLGFVVDDEDGFTTLGNDFERAWHNANYTKPTPINFDESRLQEMDFRYKAKVDDKWLKGRSLTTHKADASEFETEQEPTQIINQLKRDGKIAQKAKIKIIKRRESIEKIINLRKIYESSIS